MENDPLLVKQGAFWWSTVRLWQGLPLPCSVVSCPHWSCSVCVDAPADECGPIDAYAEPVRALNQVLEVQGPSSVRAI